jgi:hypothetical protein
LPFFFKNLKDIFFNFIKTEKNIFKIFKEKMESEDIIEQPFFVAKKLTISERLFQINIHIDAINWICNKITLSEKKSEKMTDDTLCAFIILAYQDLKIEIDPIALAAKMEVNLRKSGINKMISGTSVIKTALSQVENTISVMIISPINYIEEIVNYSSQFIELFDTRENVIEQCKDFTSKICNSNRFILQQNPKNMAAAIVYFYYSFVQYKYPETMFKENCKMNKNFFVSKKTELRLFDQCLILLKTSLEKTWLSS